ncbi:unnamed protein product [Paramecium pentaurelia]|uniref:Tubulin/FtsZ GTPase domain-containing protein n=1 Tax=Paramecium pentaurelia TaxID=43138 RepID=A0A8S1SNE0_9CILI|nr:unnamed protein product [Paramecium pentaurelia]
MMGDMLWKLYDKEHNKTTQKNYIYDQVDENYHQLALFADLDERMIYEVQRNKQIKFKKHSFNNEKEDSPNVYSRGKYAVGLYQIDQGQDFIRKQVETIHTLDEEDLTTLNIQKFLKYVYLDLYYFITSYGKMSLLNNYTRKKQNQTYFIKYLTQKEIKLYQCTQQTSFNNLNIKIKGREQFLLKVRFDPQNFRTFLSVKPSSFSIHFIQLLNIT